MERGVKMLVRIMTVAGLLGGVVIGVHPEFRDTARSVWRGEAQGSAIWKTNRAYYPEVVYEKDESYEWSE